MVVVPAMLLKGVSDGAAMVSALVPESELLHRRMNAVGISDGRWQRVGDGVAGGIEDLAAIGGNAGVCRGSDYVGIAVRGRRSGGLVDGVAGDGSDDGLLTDLREVRGVRLVVGGAGEGTVGTHQRTAGEVREHVAGAECLLAEQEVDRILSPLRRSRCRCWRGRWSWRRWS